MYTEIILQENDIPDLRAQKGKANQRTYSAFRRSGASIIPTAIYFGNDRENK